MGLIGDVGTDSNRQDEFDELVLAGDSTVLDLVLHREPDGPVQRENDLYGRQRLGVLHDAPQALAAIVNDQDVVLGQVCELEQLRLEVLQVRRLREGSKQHVAALDPRPNRAVALSGGGSGHDQARNTVNDALELVGAGQVLVDLRLVGVLKRELRSVELHAHLAAGPRTRRVSDLVLRPSLLQQIVRQLAWQPQYFTAVGVDVFQNRPERDPRGTAGVLLSDGQLTLQFGVSCGVSFRCPVHERVGAAPQNGSRHLLYFSHAASLR